MLPTLAEIGQVGDFQTRPLDGTSIRKAFEGKHIKRSKPLYWHFNAARTGPKVAIRMGNWKLLATVTGEAIKPYGDILEKNQQILKSAELDQFELYNLKKDPNETQDLASKKAAKLEEMIGLMRPMYAEVRQESVTWPVWGVAPLGGEANPAVRGGLVEVENAKDLAVLDHLNARQRLRGQ